MCELLQGFGEDSEYDSQVLSCLSSFPSYQRICGAANYEDNLDSAEYFKRVNFKKSIVHSLYRNGLTLIKITERHLTIWLLLTQRLFFSREYDKSCL